MDETIKNEKLKNNNKKKEKQYPWVIVGVYVFNDRDELLLMTGTKWHGKWIVPGGRAECGEALEETAVREVKEETNLDIEDIELLGITDGHDVGDNYTLDSDHLVFLDYRARVKGKTKVKLNWESGEYEWRSVEEWLREPNLEKYTREPIEKYLLNQEKNPWEEKYKRALADYHNLIKRTQDEKQDFVRYANEQLILDILPVYDNLKISLEHIDEAAENNGWAQGIKYVIKQFADVLKELGVEEIKTKNAKFDPASMEAVEGKGEKVKKQVKSGYKLNGKVIVPAKVILY